MGRKLVLLEEEVEAEGAHQGKDYFPLLEHVPCMPVIWFVRVLL